MPTINPQRWREQGHEAEAPEDIPKPGWWSVLKRVYNSQNSNNLSILAGGVAFFAMLSIFPALAALVAVYGLWANPGIVQHQISQLRGVIPAEAQTLIAAYLQSLVQAGATKLGVSLLVAVLFALWSARSGTACLIEALNATYEEEEKRSIIRFELVALGFTVAGIALGLIAVLLIAALPAFLKLFPLEQSAKTFGYIVPWPILMVLMSIALAAIYRYAPSRREAKWRWVSWGSVVATLLWIGASALFSVYVGKFGNYDKTFGSLGAVVVLLMWLYISAYAILLGACLNAELERQTARDSTEGPPKPMGQRGAKVADTVAD